VTPTGISGIKKREYLKYKMNELATNSKDKKIKDLYRGINYFKRGDLYRGINEFKGGYGRAVAQAVSRWLPTAAARGRVRAACGVYGEQSGTGAGFLRVLRFPLPIIPPISPSS
jgi:hypothetical protein